MLLLIGAVAGCAANREAMQRDADAAYKLGLAFLSEGRPTLALRELTKARNLTPDDPAIYNALGEAYWRKLEYGQAEESYRTAVEVDPSYSEAWNNLGALYIDQGRFEAAVEVLERAAADVMYETPERALTNLGWALHKLGRPAEARRRLREALEMAPGFPLAHKLLGLVFQEEGRHDEALEQFEEALRYLPNDPDLHLKRGVSLLHLGRRGLAREEFEAAWRLAPRGEIGKSAKTYLEFLE